MNTNSSGCISWIFIILFSFLAVACSGDDGKDGSDGNDGLESLTVVSNEPSGENCLLGGSRIDVGIDSNRNGVLDSDPNEVDHTEYLCNQFADSFDGLVFTEDAFEERRYELYAAWPTAGTVTKLASARYVIEYIDTIILSPDKTHVAYTTLPVKSLYVLDLLHPYVPPVQLSLDLYTNERIGWFAWSPDSTRIAFTVGDSTTAGKSALYSAYPDGTAIGMLVPLGAPLTADILQLAWSPDSQYIAYVYDYQVNDNYQLYVVKPNGDDITLVSVPDQAIYQTIAWAPDSSRVAYMDADRNSVFTATTDAGGSVNVTGTAQVAGGTVSEYLWSPDSTRIAFRANFEDLAVDDLFVTLATSEDRNRLSEHLVVDSTIVSDVQEFDWSADGSYLAYTSDQEVDSQFELFSATPAGVLSKLSSASSDSVDEFAWSTVGTGMAYSRGTELNFVDAQGTNHQNVDTVQNQIVQLHWAPNGRYLAYVANDVPYNSMHFGLVKVVDSEGNNPVQVSPVISDAGMWDFYTELWWSPESDQLAFEIAYPHSIAGVLGMTELYSVFPDGSGLQKLSQRPKPDVLSGLSELGVRRFRYQGDSDSHQ